MEVLGEDLFVKLQEKMDFIPHTQSYGWLKYTIAKRNKSVIFFSNSIGTVVKRIKLYNELIANAI